MSKELERRLALLERAIEDALVLLTEDSRVGVMTWRNRIDGAVGILREHTDTRPINGGSE